MIILTRLGNGLPIAVNPDLIERAEHTPDTVITLVDGHKLVVEESLEKVVELVRAWRAAVAAEAITLVRVSGTGRPLTEMVDESVPGSPHEVESMLMADRSAHGTPLARLLRLPQREG